MRPPRIRISPSKSKSQVIAAILLAILPFVALLQGFWMVRNPQAMQPWIMQIPVDRVRCDYCGGTGTVRDPEDFGRVEPCPICFGVGGHQVRKMDSKDVLCPACGGMGRVIDVTTGYARPCMRCGGRGLIRTAE